MKWVVALVGLILWPALGWTLTECPQDIPEGYECVWWESPTENVDGTPITNGAGYRVYFGPSSRNYTSMVDVPDWNTTHQLLLLPDGDNHIAATAYNADGEESAYSNEVVFTVEPIWEPPNPPTNFAVTWAISEPSTEPWYECDCPDYQLRTLEVGATIYVDRSYVFTTVGPYAGKQFLATRNGDKVRTGNPYIDVGSVLIGIDTRAVGELAWLSDWTDTGNVIDSGSGFSFRVFSGTGPINGPACPDNNCGNLILIFP